MPLRILLVEDSILDAELALREVGKAGIEYVSKRVETEVDFRHGITDFKPDINLSARECRTSRANASSRKTAQ